MPPVPENFRRTATERARCGFTLVELVMVILMLSVLAAMALPQFLDFRSDAKNASTKAALGAIRTAAALAHLGILAKEDPSVVVAWPYPDAWRMSNNTYCGFMFPNLCATSVTIFDPGAGIPVNPWTSPSAPAGTSTWFYNDCGIPPALSVGTPGQGWCWDRITGKVWANSANNGGGVGKTENYY